MNTTVLAVKASRRAWYREPWPWILMSGPLLVVVASMITAWIAYTKGDTLIAEDYYRKGLNVKQTVASSERAIALGLQARVRLTQGGVAVNLSSVDKTFNLPSRLRVTLTHPTRAGLDQSRLLVKQDGMYAGELRLPASGHWLILLEDENGEWRLLGKVVLPSNNEMVIGNIEVADIRH